MFLSTPTCRGKFEVLRTAVREKKLGSIVKIMCAQAGLEGVVDEQMRDKTDYSS